MKPLNLTIKDRRWLRTLRVSPHDIGPTCHGMKCDDCKQTGVVTVHTHSCPGSGCDCGDSDHAPRQERPR